MLTPWTAPIGTEDWSAGGSRCVGGDAAAAARDAAVVIPTVTIEDVRRIGLPTPTVTVEPDGGNVLVNVPTNVYTDDTPITRTVTLLGFDVTVEATPATFTWTFGDGSALGPTSDAGAPYPDMSTTHTYTGAGTRDVTLTTTWTARYQVAGLGWQDVVGTVALTSPPTTLRVLEGSTVLTE